MSFLYALPAFVLAIPTIPFFVLLPAYYGEDLGLGLASVGIAFFALRLLDVISDPLLGWISDALPPRYYRRKLPMIIGGIVGAPALIALFSPPENVSLSYLIAWGGVLFVAWTAIQIPYLAWAAELEPGYQQRSKLNGLREAFGLCGIVFAGGAGVVLSGYTTAVQFQVMGWVTVLAGCGCFILALRFVPEGRAAPQAPSLSLPKDNGLFWRLLTAWFVNGFANGLPAVCFSLFVTHVLVGSAEDRGLLLFVYFLSAVAGIPLWLKLGTRISKHKLWCASMLLAVVVFAFVPFLGPGDIFAFGIICVLTGFALGSDLAFPSSIQADCADWDRYRFGKERLATLFAFWSMATKLALGISVGVAFPLLGFMGLEIGGEYALPTLVFLYAGVPIFLKLTAISLMWRFPLGPSQQDAVRRALEKRC